MTASLNDDRATEGQLLDLAGRITQNIRHVGLGKDRARELIEKPDVLIRALNIGLLDSELTFYVDFDRPIESYEHTLDDWHDAWNLRHQIDSFPARNASGVARFDAAFVEIDKQRRDRPTREELEEMVARKKLLPVDDLRILLAFAEKFPEEIMKRESILAPSLWVCAMGWHTMRDHMAELDFWLGAHKRSLRMHEERSPVFAWTRLIGLRP